MKTKWYKDKYLPNIQTFFKIKRTLFSGKTKFQKIEIFDLFDFGRSLVTDGISQSSSKDEFIYHECLIHPALILQTYKDLEILILGAGEGATIRELLKYKNVKKITTVDIDKEAVSIFKKYLPGMHQGSFDDKRVELIIDSAETFLLNITKKYDVIFSDISDFTFFNLGSTAKKSQVAFYKLINKRLNKNGFFVMHTSIFNEINNKDHFNLKRILDRIFPRVFSYRAFVPFFTDYWGFLISSSDKKFNPLLVSSSDIDKKLKKKKFEKTLKYFSPEIFKAIFSLPPILKQQENKKQK
jgi:spermidine synthase